MHTMNAMQDRQGQSTIPVNGKLTRVKEPGSYGSLKSSSPKGGSLKGSSLKGSD